MSTETCGYRGSGHYCAEGNVKFISRYRGENDYCISGRRTTLTDAGQIRQCCREPSKEDLTLLYLFLLDEYAGYLQWHAENRDWLTTPLQPFTHPGLVGR
jgi:hypothetical protein